MQDAPSQSILSAHTSPTSSSSPSNSRITPPTGYDAGRARTTPDMPTDYDRERDDRRERERQREIRREREKRDKKANQEKGTCSV